MRNYINLVENAMMGQVRSQDRNRVRKLKEAPMDDDDEPKVLWSAFDDPDPKGAKPTATKTPTSPPDFGMADPTSRGSVAARNANGGISGRGAPGGAGAGARTPRANIGRVADAETTRRNVRAGDNTRASANYMDQLNRSGIQSEISDEEAARRARLGNRPDRQDRIAGPQQGRLAGPRGQNLVAPEGDETPTQENLPAVLNQEIARNGDGALMTPEWHMVRNLPGYMKTAIRGIGEQIFRPFTDVPLDKIQVMATLVNNPRDVKATMAYIGTHGRRADELEMEFDQIMPGAAEIADDLNGDALGGYKAKVQIWELAGYKFMFVKDHAGIYIYAFVGRDQQDLDHDGGPAGFIGGY